MSTRANVGRFIVALIVSVTAAVVYAANAHYKHGGEPTCTIDASGVASCSSATVTGLGNGDILVSLTVSGTAGTLCHNPA